MHIQKVLNTFHVLLATNRAVSEELSGKLKTHNIHSEILYNFGLTNNVSGCTFVNYDLRPYLRYIIVRFLKHFVLLVSRMIQQTWL